MNWSDHAEVDDENDHTSMIKNNRNGIDNNNANDI